MARNPIPGRLNRESNPVPGTLAGFNPQFYDADGHAIDVDVNNPYPVGNYIKQGNLWLPVSSDNPMPTKDYEIKQKIEELNQKVDGIIDGSTPANTQLTGSNVEIKRITKSVAANEKEEVGFIEMEGYSKFYVESHHTGLHTKNYEITFRKVTSFGQALPVEVGEFTVIEPGTYRTRISDVFDVDATRYNIYIDNKSDEILNFTISIIGII